MLRALILAACAANNAIMRVENNGFFINNRIDPMHAKFNTDSALGAFLLIDTGKPRNVFSRDLSLLLHHLLT